MRKMVKVFLYSLLVLFFLSGCNSNETNDDIFQFKDSFVGDNNAIGNIANQLIGGEYLVLYDCEMYT